MKSVWISKIIVAELCDLTKYTSTCTVMLSWIYQIKNQRVNTSKKLVGNLMGLSISDVTLQTDRWIGKRYQVLSGGTEMNEKCGLFLMDNGRSLLKGTRVNCFNILIKYKRMFGYIS